MALRRGETTALLVLALLLGAGGTTASAQTVSHRAVTLSFVYPLSTNRTPDVSSSFRLSLLYGRQHSVRGLDLNLGASLLAGDMVGVQLTGLYSQVGGDLRGVALGFGPTYVQGDVDGVQLSLFPNVVRGNQRILQYSWMVNLVEGSMSGAQLSAIFNQAGEGGGFLQLAAIGNTAGGAFRGLQMAGGFNYANGSLNGAQIGLANAAISVDGLQAGILNFTTLQNGLQIGALNMNGESRGVPIGFYNHSEKGGGVDWITYGSNLALLNTGVRTTVNGFYSMFTAGWNDVDADYADTGFLSWQYGRSFPLSGPWSLGADLGYVHIMPKATDDPDVNDKLHFAVQARVLVEFRASHKFAVFAGGGLSDIFSEYSSKATGSVEPLVVAGVSAF